MKQFLKGVVNIVVAALIVQIFRPTLQQQESEAKRMILIGLAVSAAWLTASVRASEPETRSGALSVACVCTGFTIGMVIALQY